MSQNLPVQIGIIGLGHWGPNLAKSFHVSGRANLAWICDLSAERLRVLQPNYPLARITTVVEELLADPALQAVVISTPASTHYEFCRRALEAGKHVLVEKPMTTSVSEAKELTALANKSKKILMVGQVFEYNASVEYLRRIIQRGELGKIYYCNFERTNLGPVRTDVNALWDLAAHDISILCHVLDESPHHVSALGASYLNTEVEDVVFATYLFPSGATAHIHASWLNPRKNRDITIVGSQKMAVFNDLDLQYPVRIYDKHIATTVDDLTDTFFGYKTRVVDGGFVVPHFKINQPLDNECQHFLDCILEGSTCRTGPLSGLRVVSILEATQKSMEQGGVSLPILPVA